MSLSSREKIERLISLYALTLDGGDLDGVADLFSRGCIRVDGQRFVMEGKQGVKDTLARFTLFYNSEGVPVDPLKERGRPFTRHVVSNLFFEKLTEKQAITQSCFTVFQMLPAQSAEMVISGRYRDTFACENGEWFFVERYEYIDLIGDISRHLNSNPF